MQSYGGITLKTHFYVICKVLSKLFSPIHIIMNKDMQFTSIIDEIKWKYPYMVPLGTSHLQFVKPIKLQNNKRPT
jgi:hypothetical protein